MLYSSQAEARGPQSRGYTPKPTTQAVLATAINLICRPYGDTLSRVVTACRTCLTTRVGRGELQLSAHETISLFYSVHSLCRFPVTRVCGVSNKANTSDVFLDGFVQYSNPSIPILDMFNHAFLVISCTNHKPSKLTEEPNK
jgi:hypothetical protein